MTDLQQLALQIEADDRSELEELLTNWRAAKRTFLCGLVTVLLIVTPLALAAAALRAIDKENCDGLR